MMFSILDRNNQSSLYHRLGFCTHMSIQTQIGDDNEMFRLYFDRWYNDDTRQLKGFEATLPDMLRFPGAISRSVDEVCQITDIAAEKALQQVERMKQAAMGDWPKYLTIEMPISLQWVEAFDEYYDQARVRELVARSDPEDFSNQYLVTVCEFGTVLGTVMLSSLPRLQWLPSWPYWETSVFDSQTGNVIPVFHWAIKKFSTYGIDDGFAAKIQHCLQNLADDCAT